MSSSVSGLSSGSLRVLVDLAAKAGFRPCAPTRSDPTTVCELFETPRLSGGEEAVLAEIVELRERLRYQTSEPRLWSGLLRRVAFAKAVQSSNSIEGYNVTLDDAVAIVSEEDPLDAHDITTVRAVMGYRDAMTYILQLADDPTSPTASTSSEACTS